MLGIVERIFHTELDCLPTPAILSGRSVILPLVIGTDGGVDDDVGVSDDDNEME